MGFGSFFALGDGLQCQAYGAIIVMHEGVYVRRAATAAHAADRQFTIFGGDHRPHFVEKSFARLQQPIALAFGLGGFGDHAGVEASADCSLSHPSAE